MHDRPVFLPVEHLGLPELRQLTEQLVEAGLGVDQGHRLRRARELLGDLEPHAHSR
ncbi:hypothetical protein D3C83_275470 [compost metagenome]